MLRQMRSGALSGFFLIFLLLGGVGLVLTDWNGLLTDNVAPSSIAKIGGQDLSYNEFDTQLRRYLAGREITPELAYRAGLVDEILRQQIEDILIAQAGQEFGLAIPDYLIAQRIRPLIDVLGASGFDENDALARLAAENGMSVGRFIEAYRTDYTKQLLFGALRGNPYLMSDSMAARLYQYEHESRDVSAIFFPHKAIKDIPTPSEEELQDYYQSRQAIYAIPENRILKIAFLSPEVLEQQIEISDSEQQAYYQDTIYDFQSDEERKIEQAIVDNVEQATSLIESLKEKNVSMKNAVEKVSGSDVAYRAADIYRPGDLPPGLSDLAFSSEKDVVSGPFETPLGWHVVRVLEIIPQETMAFEKVKAQIIEDLKAQQLDILLTENSELLENALAGGQGVDDIAKELGMTVVISPALDANGRVVADGKAFPFLEDYSEDADYIIDVAFDLLQGETSQILEFQDGSLAAVELEQVTPKSYEPLANVREELIGDWIGKEKTSKNFQKVQAFLEEIKSGDLALTPLATSQNLTLKAHKAIKRDKKDNAILDKNAIDVLFTQKVGAHFLSPMKDGIVLPAMYSFRHQLPRSLPFRMTS